ncbi:glutathione S-transferase T3-like [Salvia divinorum]|uniref:Glutathione S-transferase T3-like n=1 Tax=Salvia divinorum TaxID=28513 RepID=A0ABD1ILB4_SALDI
MKNKFHKLREERPRSLKMLRIHFDRVDKDIEKLCDVNEEQQYQSGASGDDILRAAMMIYQQDTRRAFKYVNTWNSVRYMDKWVGGIRSSTSSSSKRTKHTPGGQDSSSGSGDGG